MHPLKPIPEMLVKTRVARFRANALTWVDPEFIATWGSAASEEEKRLDILRRYSVGVSTTPSLQALEFLPGTETDAYAERYGGYGLARNGGGVRCVNLSGIQIKGIGVNSLIGADVLEGYASGTLNMAEGVAEVIFSRMLNRIFPTGAIKTFALIATHPTVGTYKNADEKKYAAGVPCWGALLLRETCVRPAHLMRAMFYRVAPEYKDQIPPDVVRLRRVQRSFRSYCGGDRGFLALLGRFIQASASQFAFAKIARFAHGAATASNLALDGRWLDLPIASFLPGNKNYRLSVNQLPFFSEHKVVDPTLVELVYTYGKYHGVQLDVNALLNYYQQLYKAFLHRHSSWLLGVPTALWPKPGQSQACDDLVQLLVNTLTQDNTLIWNSPSTYDAQDPVTELLHRLYSGSTTEVRAANSRQLQSSTGSFRLLLGEIHETHRETAGSDLRGFTVACAVRALRRAHLSSFFYSGRLRARIEGLLGCANPQVFGDLIEICGAVAAWVFNDDGEQVHLFDSKNLSFWWSASDGAFMVRTGKDRPRAILDPPGFVEQCAKHDFVVDGCDLRPMVQAMAVVAGTVNRSFTEGHKPVMACITASGA